MQVRYRYYSNAIVVYMTMLLVVLCFSSSSFAQSSEAVATVTAVKGSATVERLNGQIIRLQAGENIFTGDTVSTNWRSTVNIEFTDGTLTTVGKSTDFVIKQFDWQKNSATSNKAVFRLLKGAFYTVTGAITKAVSPDYTVETPLATIGIRGTEFWGGFMDDKILDVLLLSGHNAVEITSVDGVVLLTEPGQGTTVTSNRSPMPAYSWDKVKIARAVSTITADVTNK